MRKAFPSFCGICSDDPSYLMRFHGVTGMFIGMLLLGLHTKIHLDKMEINQINRENRI